MRGCFVLFMPESWLLKNYSHLKPPKKYWNYVTQATRAWGLYFLPFPLLAFFFLFAIALHALLLQYISN
jgi:hypothetical protein